MKFSASKKNLKQSLDAVNTIVSRIAMPSNKAANAIKDASYHGGIDCILEAKGNKVFVKYAQGGLVCEAYVTNAKVEEEGEAVVNLAAVISILKTSGDNFKAVVSGSKLAFSCGRTRGKIDVLKGGSSSTLQPPEGVPKPTEEIPDGVFKALLDAVTLADVGDTLNCTLHFSKKGIKAETTDGIRGVVAKAAVKLNKTGSVSMSSDVIDSFRSYLGASVKVGWSDRLFSIRTPGLYACLPLYDKKPLAVEDKMTSYLGDQEKRFEVKLKASDFTQAIDDVSVLMGMDSDDIPLEVEVDGKAAHLSVDGRMGKVESSVDLLSSTLKSKDKVLITGSYLATAVAADSKTVVIVGYTRSVVIKHEKKGESLVISIPLRGLKATAKGKSDKADKKAV